MQKASRLFITVMLLLLWLLHGAAAATESGCEDSAAGLFCSNTDLAGLREAAARSNSTAPH